MTAGTSTEEQLVGLVRNALLVAGQEMGAEGDHWPVINSTIASITQDWEQVQIERNVFEEVRNQFHLTLKELEDLYKECPKDVQPKIKLVITRLHEIYSACFASVDTKLPVAKDAMPIYLQRAKAIIKTLEDDNE
jgi:hypothetical protein